VQVSFVVNVEGHKRAPGQVCASVSVLVCARVCTYLCACTHATSVRTCVSVFLYLFLIHHIVIAQLKYVVEAVSGLFHNKQLR
jgi:hypothetical protein